MPCQRRVYAVLVALATLLAACWTAAPVEPLRIVGKPKQHVRPQCWTSEFHEQFLPTLDYYEVYTACREEWQDAGQTDACVATRYHYAYDDWVAWTRRWFESCDPVRR